MTWIDLYFRTWRSKKRVTRSCYKYNRYDFSVSVTCFTIYSYCPKNWKNSQICISGLTSRFWPYLDLEWLQNIFLALPSEFSICIIVNSMWPLHKSVLCIRIGYRTIQNQTILITIVRYQVDRSDPIDIVWFEKPNKDECIEIEPDNMMPYMTGAKVSIFNLKNYSKGFEYLTKHECVKKVKSFFFIWICKNKFLASSISRISRWMLQFAECQF